MYEIIAFYFFSIITISMFLITVLSKNPLYAMSSLAAGMVFISGFYFLLDAEFLGVVQIVVYTGAVMALYAFGMMFFDSSRDVSENIGNKKIIYTLSMLSALLVLVALLAPIFSEKAKAFYPIAENLDNTRLIGLVLFTKYLVPFEIAALMLLVAMICGIVLVNKQMQNLPKKEA